MNSTNTLYCFYCSYPERKTAAVKKRTKTVWVRSSASWVVYSNLKIAAGNSKDMESSLARQLHGSVIQKLGIVVVKRRCMAGIQHLWQHLKA